jgi:methylenetetrahydrofolate reductase (NADPH)
MTSLDKICFGSFKIKKTTKISYEFFPPRSIEDEEALLKTIKNLAKFNPEFISITYGAGGSTKETSLNLLKRIKEEIGTKVVAHLTCVGASKAEVLEVAKKFLSAGITNILALRGDMPNAQKFSPHPQGFKNTTQLIQALKEIYDFDISVACFPETHPEAKSSESDVLFFKEKVNAGASKAITQYFFNPEVYFSFQQKCTEKGINIPIIPGIIIPNNINQLKKFSNICKANVPVWVEDLYGKQEIEFSLLAQQQATAIIVYEQVRVLLENGVDHFHFYTLNKYETASIISKIIRLF